MVLTMADTIWGERMMAWREASFLESWCTITAALFTTTWAGRVNDKCTPDGADLKLLGYLLFCSATTETDQQEKSGVKCRKLSRVTSN